MIQTTRWAPDTCAVPPCVIEYQWDDALPAASRVHTPSAIIKQCSFHTGLLLAVNYTDVVAENQRKNIMLGEAVSVVAGLDPTTVLWSYDISHTLTLPVPGATLLQVTTIQTFANATFGVGTVLVSIAVVPVVMGL
jgi:hypothetical protein